MSSQKTQVRGGSKLKKLGKLNLLGQGKPEATQTRRSKEKKKERREDGKKREEAK